MYTAPTNQAVSIDNLLLHLCFSCKAVSIHLCSPSMLHPLPSPFPLSFSPSLLCHSPSSLNPLLFLPSLCPSLLFSPFRTTFSPHSFTHIVILPSPLLHPFPSPSPTPIHPFFLSTPSLLSQTHLPARAPHTRPRCPPVATVFTPLWPPHNQVHPT